MGMVKLLLRSLYVFGSALHLQITSLRSPDEGAYDLKTDNDIMEMRVGGALFITVVWVCNCKENPNSTLRDVELMLFPVIDRERPLIRAEKENLM